MRSVMYLFKLELMSPFGFNLEQMKNADCTLHLKTEFGLISS